MTTAQIISMVVSFLGSVVSGGPWGLAALVLSALGLTGVVGVLIKKFNGLRDQQDLANSGRDSGQSAVELKNQADRNRDYETRSREEILKNPPPKV